MCVGVGWEREVSNFDRDHLRFLCPQSSAIYNRKAQFSSYTPLGQKHNSPVPYHIYNATSEEGICCLLTKHFISTQCFADILEE